MSEIPGFGCPNSCGNHQQLGLVSWPSDRLGAARGSRGRALRNSHGRLHAVFRMAAVNCRPGIEVVQAVMVGKWAGLFQHWLSALLFGVLGAMIVWRPVVTAEILTLLMGAFFLVAGLFQLITPFVISLPEWGWHALNGLITLVLGVLILAQWPVSGLWVIGLFLGIELIFYGGAWIAVALGLRSAS